MPSVRSGLALIAHAQQAFDRGIRGELSKAECLNLSIELLAYLQIVDPDYTQRHRLAHYSDHH